MKLVKPSIEFLDMNSMGLKLIEKAGRTCYKSEEKICEGSDEKFADMILKNGHEAMIEFGWLCYKVICDRGVTHEIVRHRLFSYAQESTRYVNYKDGVEFIIPNWCEDKLPIGEVILEEHPELGMIINSNEDVWMWSMQSAENNYRMLIENGWKPQQARSVLPNSLKTEIVIAGNIREWRHFFKLRTNLKAHPQMREVAQMLLESALTKVPIVFDEFLEN